MRAGLLIDTTKCLGCGGCTLACKEANDLPKGDDGTLSATTWTVLEEREGVHVRRLCMHCESPACASVCPVGALRKTDEGAVVYEEDKCIGCRYCMVGCPFGIPRYEWNKPAPRMRKCILCYQAATKLGKPTACAQACPSGATKFGERAALAEEAEHRIAASPGRYVDHVFGVEEVGGTSVLFLAAVEFSRLGFPSTLRREAYPKLTWNVLSKLPKVASAAGVGLAGVWWLSHRREAVAAREKPEVKPTRAAGTKPGKDQP
jgi:formate dehydrogenase iron-sulfur subunit